ncbi:MAG TPA: hypothetical protein VFU25_09225 [Ornithinibacter sp.]|nr:hypothetical protein [Ornithinibacter sp.]
MIPTMILVGLVLGRWWRAALVAAAVGWPVLLALTGLLDSPTAALWSSVLAVANAGVGVLVHQGVLHAYRYLARRDQHAAGT